MKEYARGFILFLLLSFFTLLLFPLSPSVSTQEALAEQVLRFHVLADSNQPEAQEVKLAVRDALLSYTEPLLAGAKDKETVKEILTPLLPELTELANRTLSNAGFSYTASVHIETAYFPVKQYGSLLLPPGNYEALRVVLGRGEGKNWWCLLFPSLCFVDGTIAVLPEEGKETLHGFLTEEEYDALFDDEPVTIRFSSRLYELLLPFFEKFDILQEKTYE